MSDGSLRRRTLGSLGSRLSDATVKSRASSVFLKVQKGLLGVGTDKAHRRESLKWRDWLIAGAEFFMSFSWRSFMARAQSERTLGMRQMTPRDETLERLLFDGFSAIGNVLMGHLADGYFRNYGIVMINIAIHFALSSFFLMSEVINSTASEDEIVYGMEQLSGKGFSLVLYFSFIFQFADRFGAFVYQVAHTSGISPHAVTFMAFAANGIVLYMYANVLMPKTVINLEFSRGIAIRVWGCVVTGLKNKRKYGHRIKRKSWLDFAESRYDRAHVAKTKKLLKLFTLVLPTAGFLFVTNSYDDIFDIFWSNLNYSGQTAIYTFWVVRSTSLMTMLSVEYLVIPSLLLINVRLSFLKRFLYGYVALLCALMFSAVIMTVNEKIGLSASVGMLRVFNIRDSAIEFTTEDVSFTTLNFRVENNSGKLINYNVYDLRLFPMKIKFGNASSYVIHLSVRPYSMNGYLAVEPDLFFRIQGRIPVLEGPPGFNDKMMPRCFVANFILGRDFKLEIVNEDSNEITFVEVEPGRVTVFQVKEGTYTFSIHGTSQAKATNTVLIGGIYAIYMYLDLEDYGIVVDKVIKENFLPTVLGLGVSIPMGVVDGLAFVALLAFVFTNAPDGLKGVSVGYLHFVGNITSWFLLLGFYTWHRYISAFTLMMFTLIVTTFFFMCMVLLLKYKNIYKMYPV